MKKIIAMILAIVMMAAMSVVVFAAASETSVNADGNQSFSDQKVKVTYSTSKGYAVTIPADITITTEGVPSTFSLTKANLLGGEVLSVKIDGQNAAIDGWKWSLVDSRTDEGVKAAPVGYKIDVTAGTNVAENIDQNATILTYTSNAEAFTGIDATLKLTANPTNQVADFVDYLTFSVEITGTPAAE